MDVEHFYYNTSKNQVDDYIIFMTPYDPVEYSEIREKHFKQNIIEFINLLDVDGVYLTDTYRIFFTDRTRAIITQSELRRIYMCMQFKE